MKLKDEFIKLSSDQRLYGVSVPLIGLTGGISSGKSTVSQQLESFGLSVINADLLVKEIYSYPETLTFVEENFPDVMEGHKIKFPLLREKVFSHSGSKALVETFIYQRLPQAFKKAFNRLKSPAVVVYDVPLLFEKKMEALFDLTVLVYAPREIQRQRLMKRDGHLEIMANNILNQQMDIERKKSLVDVVIDNSGDQASLDIAVKDFIKRHFS